MPLKYPLSSLGWYNFELLAQTALKQIVGPGVSSFGGSSDGGRDATFIGKANFPSDAENWSGVWIFQVKHIDFEERGSDSARRSLIGRFGSELESVLSRHDHCDNYVYITDVPLTSGNRDKLNAIKDSKNFIGHFHVIDGKDLCQFLDLLPDLRRTYPQLLAIGDLDLIINRALYTRSEAYLQTWQPRLATFVRTNVYDSALNRLHRLGFLVLDGPPETGKSTIAAALALSHGTADFEIIDIRQPSDFFTIYDEKRQQLFVADDAVGSIRFVPSAAESWSTDLPLILRKLDEKHLLIWTTRRYVLEEALSETRLGEAISDFPGVHDVLVEVGRMTQLEKAAMLYNHAKRANLSTENRMFIKQHASSIVAHPNFTPERIRQMFENTLSELMTDAT